MAQQIRIAVCSNGLGKSRAGHEIRTKLQAARRHGFEGVEIAFECLDSHSQSPAFASHDTGPARLRAAARDVREAATELSLEIIALNPFGAYDGLADEGDVKERLEEAELWLQLCDILQAPILQVRRDDRISMELSSEDVASKLTYSGLCMNRWRRASTHYRSR